MNENFFEVVKSRIKLSEYAKKYINLKNLGVKKLVGLCPFHAEKTSSFHIDCEKELFFCFGCNSGGDLFDFYSKYHNCDKKKALIDLASSCNIQIESKKVKKESDFNKLIEFFASKSEHIEYFHKRGVNDEMISKFKLGYCPSYDELNKFINQNKLNLQPYGFSKDFLKFFQNRIIFPIYDNFNELVSMAGRCLNNSTSNKYVNGHNSEYFDKSKTLYGYNFLKKDKKVYVVEGYLDAIIMQQYGYNAVAIMGTAANEDHLKKLWKTFDNIVVALDYDAAGQNAATKIAKFSLSLLEIGKSISFLNFPKKNKDAADYLVEFKTLSALKEIPLYKFLYNINEAPTNPDERALFLHNLFELLKDIKSNILRNEYKKKIKELFWKKKEVQENYSVGFFDENYPIYLLFKYVLEYNDLIDEVGEYFLRLPLEKYFHDNLTKLINKESMEEEFLNKINNIEIVDNVNSKSSAFYAWNKIANLVYLKAMEKNNQIVQSFENNFSQQEWEKFKEWLENKEIEETYEQ